MKIKQITAGHSRKEGRPNYGSEDFHFSLTIEVEEGENLTELAKSMFETCKQKVNEQFAVADELVPQTPEKKGFDWKNTPGGQNWLERKGEIDQNFGEENGPRGYREEESVSGQK